MNRLFLYFLLVCSASIMLQAQPQIYLVRHAAKVANWPQGGISEYQPLNEKGLGTAKRLAAYFSQKSIKTVYSSSTTRTLHTAFIIAGESGAPMEVAGACADTAAIDEFLQTLSQKYTKEDTILIVSHSNIIPYFLIKAGLPANRHDEMGVSKYHGWLLADFYGDVFVIESFSFENPENNVIRKISAGKISK